MKLGEIKPEGLEAIEARDRDEEGRILRGEQTAIDRRALLEILRPLLVSLSDDESEDLGRLVKGAETEEGGVCKRSRWDAYLPEVKARYIRMGKGPYGRGFAIGFTKGQAAVYADVAELQKQNASLRDEFDRLVRVIADDRREVAELRAERDALAAKLDSERAEEATRS